MLAPHLAGEPIGKALVELLDSARRRAAAPPPGPLRAGRRPGVRLGAGLGLPAAARAAPLALGTSGEALTLGGSTTT